MASTPQLPPGWQQKTTPDGRVFYVDHNNHTTSWTPPPMSASATSFEAQELAAAYTATSHEVPADPYRNPFAAVPSSTFAAATTTTTTEDLEQQHHHQRAADGRLQFMPLDPRTGFTLSELVRYARELEGDPAGKPTFSLSNDRVLEVQLRNGEHVFARRGSMHAYRGDIKFVREGISDTGFSLALKKAFTGENAHLMKASGTGRLWLGHGGKKIVIIHLNDEAIIVNGYSILAFEQTLRYTVVVLKAGSWLSGGLFNLKISGTGSLALATHFDPMVFAVTPDMPLMTDPESTVAWSASLEPKLKSNITFKTVIGRTSGETFQLKFSGVGFVLSQPCDELPFGEAQHQR